jgi:hypothetical protein
MSDPASRDDSQSNHFATRFLFISRTPGQWPAAASLRMGLLIWLVVAVGLYALYALIASLGREG